jgi:ubiquinone/menaquinone biosynthesis C-methylase UbiE
MSEVARYDGVADWYDRELATAELGRSSQRIVLRLLGDGSGRLLDVGCGGGSFALALAARGWRVTGVDVSEDQLRLARERGVEVVRADARNLPFDAESFDAAVSIFTHTDMDDFAGALREVARVLRPEAPFVYLGVHPCFIGPHSRFFRGEGVPELFPGYRKVVRYTDGPGISPTGLRAKVGAVHLPLAALVQSFLEAGFRLERFEEPVRPPREYPHLLALRCRR